MTTIMKKRGDFGIHFIAEICFEVVDHLKRNDQVKESSIVRLKCEKISFEDLNTSAILCQLFFAPFVQLGHHSAVVWQVFNCDNFTSILVCQESRA
eukprot:CAMPEP_0115009624 /NCGR_PEP_ID=MMETSP0216-20121206/22752_1 /TAXON_ID=223996 /ORGANISM="Protocruzia adherens, Strain Boccale" /LENGTH=95 /DNA_ID=CAMNT_0002377525 /DNA_START=173 /DNA_END=460 /DNA_ORIENTATION=-